MFFTCFGFKLFGDCGFKEEGLWVQILQRRLIDLKFIREKEEIGDFIENF